MTGGMITGGWNYVLSAYGITLLVLGSYVASVAVRLRSERRRQQEERR